MYTSSPGLPILPSVDSAFVDAVEPLLLANKVRKAGVVNIIVVICFNLYMCV